MSFHKKERAFVNVRFVDFFRFIAKLLSIQGTYLVPTFNTQLILKPKRIFLFPFLDNFFLGFGEVQCGRQRRHFVSTIGTFSSNSLSLSTRLNHRECLR